VTRAPAWFAGRDIHTKGLLTDNAWSYTHNASLLQLRAEREINAKVGRFDQTMAGEWIYVMGYRSSRHRDQKPPRWRSSDASSELAHRRRRAITVR
jgi:hypothetical protein